MLDSRIPEPFHAGELRAQQLGGGGPAGAPIRAQMPEQHQKFYPLLPFICVALAEDNGWPLATLLHGEPGCVSSHDPRFLDIGALPDQDDPAGCYLRGGAAIGMLGIDFSTRRRNRANGTIAHIEERRFSVEVHQSFGNCPRYIRVRQLVPVDRKRGEVTTFDSSIPSGAASLIARCETMFVATSSGTSASEQARGLDISHRGGAAGFIRVNGNVLTIPDYAGNRYFNTMGNLILEPRASLLLVDFDSGDILQLQGMTAIDWQRNRLEDDPLAEREWTFRVMRGWLRRAAFPFKG